MNVHLCFSKRQPAQRRRLPQDEAVNTDQSTRRRRPLLSDEDRQLLPDENPEA